MISLLKKENIVLVLVLFLLTIVNIIQGYTTELLSDEAYYWVYRQYMDWGYFDHPPMVAVWVYISTLFFENSELSVRLFSSFTFSATIYFIWMLIDHRKKKEFTWLFLLIVLSTSLFNVYGFITVPDTPLLFFMALFLIGYKKYLQEKSVLSYGILAVAMAGMLYSKYQGILIIVFVLLSNVKVLKDYKIWIASLGTLFLFFPHLYWQYANDFPSFKYHLFERKENTVYRFRDTYMHLVNMIAIVGFTFPIVYKAVYKNLKNKDLFNKSLNFIVIGFVFFFFISTFRGHAQAQWIVAISIPLIIISYYFLIDNPQLLKTFKILAFITLAITTFLRFAMANDGILPYQFEMHGNKTWVKKIDSLAKGEEMLIANSYQNASLYWFYTKKRPYQYNTWWGRKNQYDLLEYNKTIQLDKAFQVGSLKENATYSIKKKNNKKLHLEYLQNVYLNKDLTFYLNQNQIINSSKKNSLTLHINNPNKALKTDNLELFVIFSNQNNKVVQIVNATLNVEEINSGKHSYSLSFIGPKTENETVKQLQLIGKSHPKLFSYRLSNKINCQLKNE